MLKLNNKFMSISSAIIFGSNFGLKYHFRSLKNFRKIKKIYICSPNIRSKKVPRKYILDNFTNINFKNIELFSIATTPQEQKKICDFGLKKKIKYFFLEKPVSNSLYNTYKILSNFKKKKIKFIINFLYPNIESFKILKKKIKNKKIKSVIYRWSFRQAYFNNYKKTWKIDPKVGGGIVNFYLIHVIYNCLFLFGKFKILKVNYKKIKRIVESVYIELIFKNNFRGVIELKINSKINLHAIKVNSSNNFYEVKNESKDWVKNFHYYLNNKKQVLQSTKNFNRYQLTKINFNKLINGGVKDFEFTNYRLAHMFCDKINKKIKYD
jgi:predicted dehydrogenase